MFVGVQLLSDRARLPTRGSAAAAGLDLYSPMATTIAPGTRQLIMLDIAINIPTGTFAHVLPRSGLAVKHGIHVGAGVIDSDYRGNLGVLLMNLGDQPFEVNVGDRIAQLVIQPVILMNVVEQTELSSTERGSNGFGSSGP